MNVLKRLRALTATDILLALAIVGLIAALTIPGVISSYKKKVYEVSVKKFYSAAKQAVTLYMARNSVTDLRATNLYGTSYSSVDSSEAINYMKSFVINYFHIAEACDHNKNKCFANSYLTRSGNEMDIDIRTQTNLNSTRDYMLPNGSVMRIGFSSDGPIELIVDTNGQKSPNRAGYDLWAMNIYYDGTIDEVFVDQSETGAASTKQELREQLFENKCQKGSYIGCFGYVLEHGFNLGI